MSYIYIYIYIYDISRLKVKPGLIDEYYVDVNRFEMVQNCLRVIVVSCRCSETLCRIVWGPVRCISNSNQLAGTLNSAKLNSDSGGHKHTSITRLMIQGLKCNRLPYAVDSE